MHNKYCKKKNLNEIVWKSGSGSQVRKKILQARDLVEHQILWRIGNTSIWFDNWIDVGDLYNMLKATREWDDKYQTVKYIIQKRAWNTQVISQLFPQEVADHIIHTVKLPVRMKGKIVRYGSLNQQESSQLN